LRRADVSFLGLGLLVAVAAGGSLLGAVVTPRFRRRLREEGILVAALVSSGFAALLAGRYFSFPAAMGLVGVFGVASGAAKVAFDSIVQRDVPEAAHGWAFARFESVLQLAWVVGGLIPLLITPGTSVGLVVCGVVANVVALAFVIGGLRVRSGALP
jgi:hypothetical protein